MILRKSPQTYDFKDLSKVIKSQIKAICRLEDENERLEMFQKLKEQIDKVLSNEDITKAVAAPKKGDGVGYYLSRSMILGASAWFTAAWINTSIPFLIPYAGAIGIAGLCAITTALVTGPSLLYRNRAKELGLTTQDVKYAHKMKIQQQKVTRYAKAIEVDNTIEKNIMELRESFKASAAEAKSNKMECIASAARHPLTAINSMRQRP